MIEKKTIYRAKENYDSANADLARYKGYGWVLVDTRTDKSENNKVEKFSLERNLDIPANQQFKVIQDDEEEVLRARRFCQNNYYYCGRKVNTYKEKKRIFGIISVLLILYSLASIAFGALFIVYPDFTKMLGMELVESESIVVRDGIPYVIMPEGVKMFGKTEMNVYNLFAVVLIAIGALILLIVSLVIHNRKTSKRIAKARIKYFEELQSDYYTLDQQLAKWTKEKSQSGFDPYKGTHFNNF